MKNPVEIIEQFLVQVQSTYQTSLIILLIAVLLGGVIVWVNKKKKLLPAYISFTVICFLLAGILWFFKAQFYDGAAHLLTHIDDIFNRTEMLGILISRTGQLRIVSLIILMGLVLNVLAIIIPRLFRKKYTPPVALYGGVIALFLASLIISKLKYDIEWLLNSLLS